MSNIAEQPHRIIEAALMVAGRPLSIADLQKLFEEGEYTTKQLREMLETVSERYNDSGVELREVSSGFQFQARPELGPWLSRLWEERAPRLSRALLETLALIAYRQPITRAEIEEIRGVVVSSNIIKTLEDREWVRVVGHKDVPGKPALLATTKTFLDHLGLKTLTDLPPLSEIMDLDKQEEKLHVQLELQPDQAPLATEESATETEQAASDTEHPHDETHSLAVEETAEEITETTTAETLEHDHEEFIEEIEIEEETIEEIQHDENATTEEPEEIEFDETSEPDFTTADELSENELTEDSLDEALSDHTTSK